MDREKVIKKAERIMCSTVDRDMIDSFCEDVIALLKEKEAVVRCKDCRHCTFSDGEQLADCMIKQGWFPVKPDWFCADGERKDGE